MTYILFILGFVFLIKGADFLVNGASSIAKKLKISNIVIGLTIVAFGTSAPELVVNVMASLEGSNGIAIGNILGSNIANILLILGISAIVYPIKAQKSTVLKEIPLSLLAIIVLGFMANDILIDKSYISELTRIDGFVLLSFFLIFLYYTFSITKSPDDIVEKENIKIIPFYKSFLLIIIGLIGLTLGGKWIVSGAIKIAEFFNISESIIGLTIIAVGTSLPELATSVVAALKKESDIAIGNVVGSNIFNIFFVLGISASINPLVFNMSSNIDILVTIFASLILFIFMFTGKRHVVERRDGILMLLFYIIYIISIILFK